MISRLFDDTELISDIIFAFLYYYITHCIFLKKYEKTKGMLIINDLIAELNITMPWLLLPSLC